MVWRYLVLTTALALSGCSVLPEIAHQPTLHNPFPQLSKIAVTPFINLSDEPTLDGRQFGLAYFNELQVVPGFEVIPLGVVEAAMEGAETVPVFREVEGARTDPLQRIDRIDDIED